ncbi:MAG TPA: hypothetical protein VKY74_14820 [Chloroflexia bacterium]|nr:hypothetical protein [Chloroflexia bacterium]
MAPPRLPQIYIARLVPLLATLPALAGADAEQRGAFRQATYLDWHFRSTTGFDWDLPAHELATHLLGSAANVVPAYDGPRQGWSALGEIGAALLAAPSVGPADREFLAALIVRYQLIRWDRPGVAVPADLRAVLARVPPQPPPNWEGGMFPPTMQR